MDESAPENTGPLVTVLPRQPGSREARYAHLLGVPPDLTTYPAERAEATTSTSQRLTQLEAEVTTLSAALETLKSRVDQLEARLPSQAEASVSINDSSVR